MSASQEVIGLVCVCVCRNVDHNRRLPDLELDTYGRRDCWTRVSGRSCTASLGFYKCRHAMRYTVVAHHWFFLPHRCLNAMRSQCLAYLLKHLTETFPLSSPFSFLPSSSSHFKAILLIKYIYLHLKHSLLFCALLTSYAIQGRLET